MLPAPRPCRQPCSRITFKYLAGALLCSTEVTAQRLLCPLKAHLTLQALENLAATTVKSKVHFWGYQGRKGHLLQPLAPLFREGAMYRGRRAAGLVFFFFLSHPPELPGSLFNKPRSTAGCAVNCLYSEMWPVEARHQSSHLREAA